MKELANGGIPRVEAAIVDDNVGGAEDFGTGIPIVDGAVTSRKMAIKEADCHQEQLLPSGLIPLEDLLQRTTGATSACNAASRRWHDLGKEISLRAGPIAKPDKSELDRLSQVLGSDPDVRNNELIPFFTKMELLSFRFAIGEVEVYRQVWAGMTLGIPLIEGPLMATLRQKLQLPDPDPPVIYFRSLMDSAFAISRAFEDVRQALEALRQRVLLAIEATSAAISDGSLSSARHSADFVSVNWFGTVYVLSTHQAACVRVMWEAWENRTPILSESTIQEAAGVDSPLRHVFRKHPAWGVLIVSPSKGRYRLAEPVS